MAALHPVLPYPVRECTRGQTKNPKAGAPNHNPDIEEGQPLQPRASDVFRKSVCKFGNVYTDTMGVNACEPLSFIKGQIYTWLGNTPMGPSIMKQMVEDFGPEIYNINATAKDKEELRSRQQDWLKQRLLPKDVGLAAKGIPVSLEEMRKAVKYHCLEVKHEEIDNFDIPNLLFRLMPKKNAVVLQRCAILFFAYHHRNDPVKVATAAILNSNGSLTPVFREPPSAAFVGAMANTWYHLSDPQNKSGVSYQRANDLIVKTLKEFGNPIFHNEEMSRVRNRERAPHRFIAANAIPTLAFLLQSSATFEDIHGRTFNGIVQQVRQDLGAGATTVDPIRPSPTEAQVAPNPQIQIAQVPDGPMQEQSVGALSDWRSELLQSILRLCGDLIRGDKSASEKVKASLETIDSELLASFAEFSSHQS